MIIPFNILQIVGQLICNIICNLHAFIIFFLRVVYHCFFSLHDFRPILLQIFKLGYLSIPIIGLTAIFTGAVLALQSYTGFAQFHIQSAIPGVVVMSITRELGPVLVGLMFAGRVGSSICAELSSMKVTEQLDALSTLYTNTFKYFIAPRMIASIITLPILVLIADVIGIYGGYLTSVYKLHFTHGRYIENTAHFLRYNDVMSGVIKAIIFGIIVSTIGCYCGYNCKNGAKGVGMATTRAVVLGSILILFLNYITTSLLFV